MQVLINDLYSCLWQKSKEESHSGTTDMEARIFSMATFKNIRKPME
jgi:hypothetical protein